MEFKKRENKEFTRVNITGDLTIYNAEKLWSHFSDLETTEVEKPIKINLEKVEEIDTSGVQLLMQLNSKRYKRDVEIDATNQEFNKLMKLLELNLTQAH